MNLKWSMFRLHVREGCRAAAADVQNASIFWVVVLLLFFPYSTLPTLYVDLGRSLARFQVPNEGLVYGLFLSVLAFALAYQRRHHFSDSLCVRRFARTLPLSYFERILSDLFLGAMCQFPVLFIQITAAITVFLLPHGPIGLGAHISAQAFSSTICLISVWAVRKWKFTENNRKSSPMRLPGAFGFSIQSAVHLAPFRFIFFLLVYSFAIAVLGFRSDLDPPVTVRLTVAVVGLICMTAHWAFLPWRDRLKASAGFLTTLPTIWLEKANGERFAISILALILGFVPLTSPREAALTWVFAGCFPFFFPTFIFWTSEHQPRWSFLISLSVLALFVLFAA